jgi:prepilin-type N-terminal cleavage/methylation domain-containing protein
MKTTSPQPRQTGKFGFTLIEMIGVLAIMAILAAAITPNALRTLDRAAVRAEADTLHNLGEQVKLYLRDNGIAPTAANWNTVLATYASLSPADLLYNRRQNIPDVPPNDPRTQTDVVYANGRNFITRVFILEPVVFPALPTKAMLISSMRNGVLLPAALLPTPNPSISAVDFASVWSTPDGYVPVVPGWAAWNNYAQFLVIERINLAPVYSTDLQRLTITLNNKTPVAAVPPAPAVPATDASYIVVLANGTAQPRQTVAANTSTTLPPLHPRDRIDLYRVTSSGFPDSSYVLSAGSKTSFDFNGTNWLPQ